MVLGVLTPGKISLFRCFGGTPWFLLQGEWVWFRWLSSTKVSRCRQITKRSEQHLAWTHETLFSNKSRTSRYTEYAISAPSETSSANGQHSCFLLGRSRVTSARRLTILNFICFFSPFREISGHCFILGHNRFLPHHSLFITHGSLHHLYWLLVL